MKKANIFLPVLLLLCMVTSLIGSCSNNTAFYYADYTPLGDIIPKLPNEPDTDFYITTTAAKSKFLMSSMYYADGETDNYSGVFFRTNESIAEDLAASENRLAEAEKELDSALKAEEPDTAGLFWLRYRKAAIWARVQGRSGPKVVAEVPLAIPFSAAQRTASAQ